MSLYQIIRRNGYSRTEAFFSVLCSRLFGTKVYYYPRRRRK